MTARAWQRMLSGRRLDLLDPSPLDVEIEDIAHGLAFVARPVGARIRYQNVRRGGPVSLARRMKARNRYQNVEGGGAGPREVRRT